MPSVSQDGRPNADPTKHGNVSTFTAVEDGRGVMRYHDTSVRFPLNPFMGTIGVEFSQDVDLTASSSDSIPPTLGQGNIDIRLLGVGSTFYPPVFAEAHSFAPATLTWRWVMVKFALTTMEAPVYSKSARLEPFCGHRDRCSFATAVAKLQPQVSRQAWRRADGNDLVRIRRDGSSCHRARRPVGHCTK
jgi:hypothetical protein